MVWNKNQGPLERSQSQRRLTQPPGRIIRRQPHPLQLPRHYYTSHLHSIPITHLTHITHMPTHNTHTHTSIRSLSQSREGGWEIESHNCSPKLVGSAPSCGTPASGHRIKSGCAPNQSFLSPPAQPEPITTDRSVPHHPEPCAGVFPDVKQRLPN